MNRVFVMIVAVGPLAAASMLPVLYIRLLSLGRYEEDISVLLTAFTAITAWGAFKNAFYGPMYSPAFWRRGISEGWVKPNEREYYAELARYHETGGASGQLNGDALWGVAYFAVYLVSTASAILYALTFYPLWGSWAFFGFVPIEGVIALSCWIAYGRRLRRRLVRAQTNGFRLLELRKRMTKVDGRRS